MSRTTFTSLLLGLVGVWGMIAVAPAASDAPAPPHPAPALNSTLERLFSHARHRLTFEKADVSCVNCHGFTVKPNSGGPLGGEVGAGFLKAPRESCHQCHVDRFTLSRPNQCLLCHRNTELLKPQDHFLAWRERHGRMAQLNPDSCASCHTTSTCSTCHAKQDSMNPVVHPANFRLFHSLQARANPASCIQCHKSAGFCVDCHTGRRFR